MIKSISLTQLNHRSQSTHKLGSLPRIYNEALDITIDTLRTKREPVIACYSGGKDSSASLVVLLNALRKLPKRARPQMHLVYCDTGVEIPPASRHAINTIRKLKPELQSSNIDITTRIVRPPINNRFMVRVIGRGYATPTNFFRWCTRDLRLNPVKKYLKELDTADPTIVLGTRLGESTTRDNSIARYSLDSAYFQINGAGDGLVFCPVVHFDIGDIWDTIHNTTFPISINRKRLFQLYKNAGAECPPLRDPKAPPCGKGRFGCWTCTVVSRDRAVTNLIQLGSNRLQPLLDWRNWIAEYRDNPKARCKYRRNGDPGPGPFTLRARSTILRRLKIAESSSGYRLLTIAELNAIHKLWALDRNDPTYKE